MEAKRLISELADNAKSARFTLVSATSKQRVDLLQSIANELENQKQAIIAANLIDIELAKKSGISESLLDRLKLDETRVTQMAQGVRNISNLADPLGEVIAKRTLENGLQLEQVRVPFGVVGMIYEARPNVTVDAVAILLKSGNTALMRGSTSAVNTNRFLIDLIRTCLSKSNLSPNAVQLVPPEDRETVAALLTARGEVDLVIPRGGAELIRMVVDQATVPTIETGAGVCHVYIDKSADQVMAIDISLNSKVQRPSVCNAAESILVHQEICEEFLPKLLLALKNSGVIVHGDSSAIKIGEETGIKVYQATDQSWSTEYGTREVNLAVVKDLESAILHINKYGTKHTEAIVAKDQTAINSFVRLNDSAAIMINASTRFTDGEQMGFGAEIGISNQKLHARGPMGVAEMTTTTWIVTGNGQVRT